VLTSPARALLSERVHVMLMSVILQIILTIANFFSLVVSSSALNCKFFHLVQQLVIVLPDDCLLYSLSWF